MFGVMGGNTTTCTVKVTGSRDIARNTNAFSEVEHDGRVWENFYTKEKDAELQATVAIELLARSTLGVLGRQPQQAGTIVQGPRKRVHRSCVLVSFTTLFNRGAARASRISTIPNAL